MEVIPIQPLKRWYTTLWGIALAGFGLIFLGVGIFLAAKVSFYYWQIKARGLDAVNLDFSRQFTPLSAKSAASNAGARSLVYNVATADDPSFGNKDGQLTIVMFADFECPFSKEVSVAVRELSLKYKDRINLIYRDFPLDDVHKNARQSAEAGYCAAIQGKFWAYFDKLFAASPALDEENLKQYALQIGLDEKKFKQCLSEAETREEVQADYDDGLAAGIRGTPTFFFNGVKIEGAIPKDIFEKIIQRSLTRNNK